MTEQPIFYWSYIYDGDEDDSDYGSKKAAQEAADKWYAEYIQDIEDMRNGETFSEEIELIAYTINEDGERKRFTTVKSTVEYEHYHGDMAEHGVWG